MSATIDRLAAEPRRRHPIVVSPLEAQPEPEGLGAIKAELGRRWPMTGLLDVLKESDLRVGFTEAFATAAAREAIDRDEVRRRLLLCLYGLGTNRGGPGPLRSGATALGRDRYFPGADL